MKKIVWFIISLAAVYFTLPGRALGPAGSGLDPSWKIALQVAYDKGLIYGKDIAFTYGPLGYIFARIYSENSKLSVILFDLFVFLQFILIPFAVYAISPRIVTALLLFLLYFILSMARYYQDAAVILFLMSSFWLFCDQKRSSPAAFTLSLLNAVIAFYLKVNLGLAAVLQLVAVSALSAIRKETRTQGIKRLTAFMIVMLGSALILPVSLPEYVRTALHFADSYNDAMYLHLDPKNFHYLYRALTLLGILAVVLAATVLKKENFIICASCAGFSFLIFKQGFVRADGHIFAFFDYIPVPFAMLALFPRGRLRVFNSIVFAGVAAYCYYSSQFASSNLNVRYNIFMRYYQSFFSVPPSSGPVLPPDIIAAAGQETIDHIPHFAFLLYHSGLNYHPRPAIQSYSAYDGLLDSINARFLRESGPQFILFENGCIDYRFCQFDETETKIAMLENYELKLISDHRFLMARMESPRPFQRKLVKSGTHQIGQEFKLKKTDGIQIVKFYIKYSLRGKIRRFLYQPPALRIRIRTAGSRERGPSYRAVVPIINAGVIATPDIQKIENTEKFLKGRFNEIPAIESVRFQTKQLWGFRRHFSYEVYELTRADDGKF